MQVSRRFMDLLLWAVAAVQAMPFWNIYFPDDSPVSIVPSIQTHEEHSSHYYPFDLGDGQAINQLVFLGQSRFLDEIIGNSNSKKKSQPLEIFTTTEPSLNNLRSSNSLASSGPFFTSGPSNSFFTGPERLPFSAGFVPDLTQALFRPTLVPYNDTITTTTLAPVGSRLQTAATSSTVGAPPPVKNLTDRTAPTSAPIFAALVSSNSFDGTEVPPGQQKLAVKTRQQRDSNGAAEEQAPPKTDYYFDSQRLYTVKTTNSRQPGTNA